MKHKKNIADSVMEKINKEHIVPKARWEFLLKNYAMWGAGILSVIVGGIATSGMIFVLINADWMMYQRLSGSFFEHAMSFVPMLWIGLLVCFAGLAIYQMKHTKRGYTYPVAILVGANILASTVLGVGIYSVGYAHVIDVHAGKVLPMYRGVEEKREALWVQPDKGILAGVVVGTTTEGAFLLKDYTGYTWEVVATDLSDIDTFVLETADEVGVVGHKTGDTSFEACAARPWNIAGQHPRLREEMRGRLLDKARKQEGAMFDAPPPEEEFRAPSGVGQVRLQQPNSAVGAKFQEGDLDRVRLQDLRDVMCKRATTTLQ